MRVRVEERVLLALPRATTVAPPALEVVTGNNRADSSEIGALGKWLKSHKDGLPGFFKVTSDCKRVKDHEFWLGYSAAVEPFGTISPRLVEAVRASN